MPSRSPEERRAEGTRQGRFYGYPECCIEYFEDHADEPWNRWSKVQREASQYSGFMPCPPCAARVVSGVDLHNLIQPTRQATRPFRICRVIERRR